MRLVVRIVDETTEVHTEVLPQMFENPEGPDFLAFVGRKGDAVTQEKQRARWGQMSTSVGKNGP